MTINKSEYYGIKRIGKMDMFWKDEKNLMKLLKDFVRDNTEVNRGNICVYNFLFKLKTREMFESAEWEQIEKMVWAYEVSKAESRKAKRQNAAAKAAETSESKVLFGAHKDEAKTNSGIKDIIMKPVMDGLEKGANLRPLPGNYFERACKYIDKCIANGFSLYASKWSRNRLNYYFTKESKHSTKPTNMTAEDIAFLKETMQKYGGRWYVSCKWQTTSENFLNFLKKSH